MTTAPVTTKPVQTKLSPKDVLPPDVYWATLRRLAKMWLKQNK